MALATVVEISWIGVGPDPSGSVSATYTGRSTVIQVVRPCVADAEPVHVVDHLEGRAHHEVVGSVEPAAQDHRLAVGLVLPGRGAGRGGFGGRRALVVTELSGSASSSAWQASPSACGAGTDAIGDGTLLRRASAGWPRRPGRAMTAATATIDRGDHHARGRAVASVGGHPATLRLQLRRRSDRSGCG